LVKLARVLVLVGALSIVVVGALGGGIAIVVGLFQPAGDRLSMITVGASLLVLSVGLGLALAWQAWQAVEGRKSGPFQPRRLVLWAVVFLVVVLAGQLVLSLDLLPALLFPPLHIAAAVLPPLLILGAMGRSLGRATRWRDVVLEIGSGAFLSTLLAFSLEFAAILILLLGALAVVAAQPGGSELLQNLADSLQNATWLQDPTQLAPLANSPILIGAALLLLAGVIPLVEELVKTVGVGLLAYRRPSLPAAVLWGLASGAGFALSEGMFNSASGLDLWAGVVLLRVGASSLHCFTGGLMGLAWYELLSRGRWLRTAALYAASVAVHGLWNSLATGMSFISLRSMAPDATLFGQGLAGAGILVLLGSIVVLTCGVWLGLVLLARYARRYIPPHRQAQTELDPAPSATPSKTEGGV
jgi:hypothetical protein